MMSDRVDSSQVKSDESYCSHHVVSMYKYFNLLFPGAFLCGKLEADLVCESSRRTGPSPKDILMRVVAENLSPQSTLVEKVMTPNPDYKDGYVVGCIDVLQITHAAISMVMTPNPDCPSVDTTILDEVHMVHDGKFLNLPLIDKDVLQMTHAAISMVNFMF
ncbi:hypothetical protein VNO80_17997 [Phaseolus coccineus]|uniref:CBS domain-containing protein n=1 Tax=Phaseolus coccineus TaxID=3886 RepID=A0AAN9MIB3_PHACN